MLINLDLRRHALIRAKNCCGLHFFYPFNANPYWEVATKISSRFCVQFLTVCRVFLPVSIPYLSFSLLVTCNSSTIRIDECCSCKSQSGIYL